MKLESFAKHQFSQPILDIKFMPNRNLLAFQFHSKIEVYRLFEQVFALTTTGKILFTNNQLAIHSDTIKIFSLKDGSVVDTLESGNGDYYCFNVGETPLFFIVADRVIVRNMYFTLFEIEVGNVIKVEQIPNTLQFVLMTSSEIHLVSLEAFLSNAEFIQILSNSRQDLHKGTSILRLIVGKFQQEFTNIKNIFEQLTKRLELVYEEFLRKPEPIDWKRFVCIGDHDSHLIQPLASDEKQFQLLQKQLNNSKQKFKTIYFQLMDVVEDTGEAFGTLNSSNQLFGVEPNTNVLLKWSPNLTSVYLDILKVVEGKQEFISFLLSCIQKKEIKAWETKYWFIDLSSFCTRVEQLSNIGDMAQSHESISLPFTKKSFPLPSGIFLSSFECEDQVIIAVKTDMIINLVQIDSYGLNYCCFSAAELDIKQMDHIDGHLIFLSQNSNSLLACPVSELSFGPHPKPAVINHELIYEFEGQVAKFQINPPKGVLCVEYGDQKTIELFDFE